MKQSITTTISIYIVLLVLLIGSTFTLFKDSLTFLNITDEDIRAYQQPPLPAGQIPWTIRSVDTQVISKHWPDVTQEAINEQVKLLKDLGVNYIAIGTPYDRGEEFKMWADAIHAEGLNVWYRSHWASWEGDEGLPAVMKPKEYLSLTDAFIRENHDVFKPGDAFTATVEAEQVGIGFGKRFLNWDEYRQFLLDEIKVSNAAFTDIGLEGQIHTNWLSVNGWIVDNQFTPELVSKLNLIVVDHFVGQTETIGGDDDIDMLVDMTLSDLDRYHSEWDVPILLGEWGYQIYQPVSDEKQAEAAEKMFSALRTRDYLVGVNYWTHMGNSASIIGDEFGSQLKYREAAFVIKKYFDPESTILLEPTEKPQ